MNIPRVSRLLSIAALGLLLAAVSTSAQPADVTSHNLANFAIPRLTFGSEFASSMPGATLGAIGRSPFLGLHETGKIEFTTAVGVGSQDDKQKQTQTAKTGKSWPARHPVLTGALIGGAAGAVLGATGKGDGHGTNEVLGVLAGAGVFGGVGALIGLAF